MGRRGVEVAVGDIYTHTHTHTHPAQECLVYCAAFEGQLTLKIE